MRATEFVLVFINAAKSELRHALLIHHNRAVTGIFHFGLGFGGHPRKKAVNANKSKPLCARAPVVVVLYVNMANPAMRVPARERGRGRELL
jgi:hypothetical protein